MWLMTSPQERENRSPAPSDFLPFWFEIEQAEDT
jgi:hypothetical protein